MDWRDVYAEELIFDKYSGVLVEDGSLLPKKASASKC